MSNDRDSDSGNSSDSDARSHVSARLRLRAHLAAFQRWRAQEKDEDMTARESTFLGLSGEGRLLTCSPLCAVPGERRRQGGE
jgi:hypothetical protein